VSDATTAVELWIELITHVQSRDLDAARSLAHPTLEWELTGRGPFAGTYVGVEGLAQLLANVRDASGGTFQLEPEGRGGDAAMGAVVGRVTATRNGRTLQTRNAFLIQCQDGKISHGWTVPMDQYTFDEFWR
jgi:ketosteroid isomerase-like protein